MTTNIENPRKLRKGWFKSGAGSGDLPPLFQLDELDIYTNRATGEAYIFHRKDVDHDLIERLEYDDQDHGVDVVMKDGRILDLGAKIQWLIRPYFTKAEFVTISQTRNGQVVKEKPLPLLHKSKKDVKN